jgi:uncharacterized spore protein YtfJ
MDIDKALRAARRAVSGHQVFSTPVEHDGVIVIPAATVAGGGGTGFGEAQGGADGDVGPATTAANAQGLATGGGGGFGVRARPAGAFVIRDGDARWVPAFDPNRVVIGATMVATAAVVMLGLGRLFHRRRRHHR